MKLYRLTTWAYGQKLYAAGEPVRFIQRRDGGRLFTRTQAAELRRRFKRVKLKLKLEEVPPRTQPVFSEMVRD